jgi:hypothetical protein
MKHWTTSNIKGGKEFSFTNLWEQWVSAYRKVKYNETNWINEDCDLFTVGKTSNLFEKIPFMSTTNKLAVLLVHVNKTSTSPLKQIRLSAYDPDTDVELAYSRTEAISTTSKQSTKSFNGEKRFLSYTYSILTFTPSTTYINDSGFPIKKRVNLKLEALDGITWKALDGTLATGYLKFIEIGPDDLTGGSIVPTYNETIPQSFLSSFYGLATGELYDESTGLRYLNYIIPARQGVKDSMRTVINLKENSILSNLVSLNKNLSTVDSNYYEIMKIIRPDTLTNIELQYTEGAAPIYYNYIKNLATSYANWKEYDLINSIDVITNDLYNTGLVIYKTGGSTDSEIMNIASASMLPGYLETSLSKIWEFCLSAVTQANKQPIDNITMSIIESTFKLPFWKYKRIDEVITLAASRFNDEGEYIQEYSSRANNGYFDANLQLVNTGDCDIVETGVEFYCKFSF